MHPKKHPQKISRRDLLKASAALSASVVVSGCGGGSTAAPEQTSQPPGQTSRPNVLFILVDQMRFPKFFPSGINSADDFIKTYMPNTYTLWKRGVKFSNHYIAATACGPSRSTLVTGLYTQQTWCAATYAPVLGNTPPELSPDMPTYGKLFQAAGYDTPYMGKWHLSEPWKTGMARYGFDGITEQYSLDAGNLQGTYSDPNNLDANGNAKPFYNDEFIAKTAASWLQKKRVGDLPWCLTVGLQNPHDYQFFPSGTEFKTFTNLFSSVAANPSKSIQAATYSSQPSATGVNWDTNIFNNFNASAYGYPAVPPNWESLDSLWKNKPKYQILCRQWNGMQFGDASELPSNASFNVKPYPDTSHVYSGFSPYVPGTSTTLGNTVAPYSYWQRGMAAYTLSMEIVDKSIGLVLDSIPDDVSKNTIIVFTSDHGEQAGSHGFVSNKSGEIYDETIHVPLMVVDLSGKFTGDLAQERTQITSSIDLVAMMVSFAYGGTRSWLTGDNATLYSKRFDMFPLLKSASAAGRDYALFSTDETVSLWQDFVTAPNDVKNQTAGHILGLIAENSKLGIYSNWTPGTVDIANDGRQEGEFYDFITSDTRLELDNFYSSPAYASRVAFMKNQLINDLLPNEMRAPLPASLVSAQNSAKQQLIDYYISQQS
ncbi:MAG: sulfatase-like hydrolase/transferase [Burkholderiaceae bacterium]